MKQAWIGEAGRKAERQRLAGRLMMKINTKRLGARLFAEHHFRDLIQADRFIIAFVRPNQNGPEMAAVTQSEACLGVKQRGVIIRLEKAVLIDEAFEIVAFARMLSAPSLSERELFVSP